MGITNTHPPFTLKPYPPFPLERIESPQLQWSSPTDLASPAAWAHRESFHHPPLRLPLSFVGSLAFHSGTLEWM